MGMKTTFAIEQPMTGLFEFVCLAVFKPVGPFESFADAEAALAAHARSCDECALTGAYVEPQRVATPRVVVPGSLARLVLSAEELSRNVYRAEVPALEAEDLLGRTLVVGAMLPAADAEALAERIALLSELALDAKRTGLRVTWE